jgi:hypothetical protein
MSNVLKRVAGVVALKMPLWGYTVSSALIVGVLYLTALTLTPAPALALPEGRVYEMVSPPFKGGYGVGDISGRIKAVAPDGESVAFNSVGVFAGAPCACGLFNYVARRGVSGWSTAPMMPPAALLPSTVSAQDVSPSLGSTVVLGEPGPNRGWASHLDTETEFLLHDTSAPDTVSNWERAVMPIKSLELGTPPGLNYHGASANLCHFVASTQGQAFLPEAVGALGDIFYEADRGCGGGSQSLRLLGVKNSLGPSGEPELLSRSCPSVLGTNESTNKNTLFNAISADGREVFFAGGIGASGICAGPQLFLRLGGVRTLEVSKPVSEAQACGEVVPCPGAASRASGDFVGASEDGSVVFFTTAAPLEPATDMDKANDLYMARIGCPSSEEKCEVARREVTSLVQVSHDAAVGEAAEMQGVVRVAPDGSRVYFVARGVLGVGPGVEGRAPVKGADNLYVYNGVSGKTLFISDLCSGPGLSGAVEDSRCPSNLNEGTPAQGVAINDRSLWFGNVGEAQTAGLDGRFLVFSSYGQLLGDDTDAARDVYRYDAETGSLSRVSVGEGGNDANGNSVFDATIAPGGQGGSVAVQYEMGSRAISEDGSRIVFTTAEPLSSGAVNGLANVYEWHQQAGEGEGTVSLISSGSAEQSEGVGPGSVVISPSGNDIFFVTSQGLVPQDTDGAVDVYDARLHGGFPLSPAARQPCAGDACQGPLTNPAPLLVPGSVSQAPGANFAAPAATVKAKATPRCSKAKKPVHGKCVKVKAKGNRKTRAKRAGYERRAK